MKELLKKEKVQRALVFLKEDDDRTLQETLEMCQIPERGQIVGTWKDYIRAGEELLWIQRKGRDQEDSFCLR